MIKFRNKIFTISEGHYTGPKDMENLPGYFEMVGKGAAIGGIGGAVLSKAVPGIANLAGKPMEERDMMKDALTGAKYGALAGLAGKFFINYLHKPMNRVKYQEVDRAIRQKFGVYSYQGITVGDDVSKRATINEKFEFNDRDVTNYKLNFAVHDDVVTMYTFGLTDDEFKKVDRTLDYYCKKFYGVNYSSHAINPRANSYAVDITFNNNNTIAEFMMELSGLLLTKINLLDNGAIVEGRLKDSFKNRDEIIDENKGLNKGIKTFSRLSSLEIGKILGKGGRSALRLSTISPISPDVAANFLLVSINEAIKAKSKEELIKMGFVPNFRGDLNSTFLLTTLKKLRYVEGFNYVCNDPKNSTQVSLMSGTLLITVNKKDKETIDEINKSLKGFLTRVDTDKVVAFSYSVKKINDFEYILKKLLSITKPNVFK